ncbi:hypothetical protein MPRM_14400 [Mycobacterium parmense]|uniref:Uncharacterized protein n=1 Tax=Mycobacterium parmense TaxID=185642 RepID=A0A7I7YR40_9MYCO|nr:hypothetical protein MPRM_14400 [Mycobacterium parmense]
MVTDNGGFIAHATNFSVQKAALGNTPRQIPGKNWAVAWLDLSRDPNSYRVGAPVTPHPQRTPYLWPVSITPARGVGAEVRSSQPPCLWGRAARRGRRTSRPGGGRLPTAAVRPAAESVCHQLLFSTKGLRPEPYGATETASTARRG